MANNATLNVVMSAVVVLILAAVVLTFSTGTVGDGDSRLGNWLGNSSIDNPPNTGGGSGGNDPGSLENVDTETGNTGDTVESGNGDGIEESNIENSGESTAVWWSTQGGNDGSVSGVDFNEQRNTNFVFAETKESRIKFIQDQDHTNLLSECSDEAFHVESVDDTTTYPAVMKGCVNNGEADYGEIKAIKFTDQYVDSASSSYGYTMPFPDENGNIEDDIQDDIYCDTFNLDGFAECGTLTMTIATYKPNENEDEYTFFLQKRTGKPPQSGEDVFYRAAMWAVNSSYGSNLATGADPSEWDIGARCKGNSGSQGNPFGTGDGVGCITDNSYESVSMEVISASAGNKPWIQTCFENSGEVKNQVGFLDRELGGGATGSGDYLNGLGVAACTVYHAKKCVQTENGNNEICGEDNMQPLCSSYGMNWNEIDLSGYPGHGRCSSDAEPADSLGQIWEETSEITEEAELLSCKVGITNAMLEEDLGNDPETVSCDVSKDEFSNYYGSGGEGDWSHSETAEEAYDEYAEHSN